ncbi:MAG: hypothetical protein E6R04_02275 [Spirochaetes bacterium]|nr:MAG: hypothetical protein E6R04_02275 [Spirochaetota bacterium]
MALNIKALAEKFAELSGEKKKKSYAPPFPVWKPMLTEDGKAKTYNIRCLPVEYAGQPFYEIGYYDNKKLSPFRLVAPAQFGLPDPVSELVAELNKDRKNSKNAWNTIRPLLPQSRFLAPILVREEKEKGVQVYEISKNLCKKFYQNFLDDEYRDEPLHDALIGRDFKLTVSPSGKEFKNETTGKTYPVNDVDIRPAGKTSKLAATQEEIDKLVASVPNFDEIFKGQVKSYDDLAEMLRKYLDVDASAISGSASSDDATDDALLKSVEDQFNGL